MNAWLLSRLYVREVRIKKLVTSETSLARMSLLMGGLLAGAGFFIWANPFFGVVIRLFGHTWILK